MEGYKKFIKLSTLLLSVVSVLSSEFDLIDNEIIIDYNHKFPIHKYFSDNFNLSINLLTKNRFIAGSVMKNINQVSTEVNHFEIYGIDDEPNQVYFNGEPLYYLNWFYDHDNQMIGVVNVDHDITQDFIIEWTNDSKFD